MRYNDREIAHVSSFSESQLEGRLNYRKTTSGNFSQSGVLNSVQVQNVRAFLAQNMILTSFGLFSVWKLWLLFMHLVDPSPAGVLVLESSHVQCEHCTGLPFAFSLTFSDDPDRKHVFSARSEDTVQQWVNALRAATYEYWRSQLILLQSKLNLITGKDPLLMYPHNRGTVRDFGSTLDSVQSSTALKHSRPAPAVPKPCVGTLIDL